MGRSRFIYDRKLLADLSRCAWESMKVFLQEAVPENDPIPGAVIAMQTFGDFLGYNPHAHIPVTDGCFYGNAKSTNRYVLAGGAKFRCISFFH